jgi:hypothetical protein
MSPVATEKSKNSLKFDVDITYHIRTTENCKEISHLIEIKRHVFKMETYTINRKGTLGKRYWT